MTRPYRSISRTPDFYPSGLNGSGDAGANPATDSMKLVVGVLRTGDVARYAGVSPQIVMQWADRGMLPCWRLPAKRAERRYEPKVVLEFLRDHNMPIPDELRRMVYYGLQKETICQR